MARATAAVVLAFAVCCLLAATAPARHPADLPPRELDAVDREAAAGALVTAKPMAGAEDADQGNALAVPEEGAADAVRGEEEWPRRSSLLCLVFRCGDGEPADARSAVVARGSSEDPEELDGRASPVGKAEVEDEEVGDEEEKGLHDSDCDSDWDSDSDDEDEGGVLGWLWSLAHGF